MINFTVLVLPFILTGICCFNNFDVETAPMLNMFLPLVWGILFALGGSVVYLNNHQFNTNRPGGKILSAITEKVKNFSLILIAHSMIFIVVSILYPTRFFIVKLFKISEENFLLLRCLGDCLLFSTIFVPAVASVLVGACCLLVSFNQNHIIKKN